MTGQHITVERLIARLSTFPADYIVRVDRGCLGLCDISEERILPNPPERTVVVG